MMLTKNILTGILITGYARKMNDQLHATTAQINHTDCMYQISLTTRA